MELWQLQQLQGLPLELKIEKSKLRIKEWYEYWKGQVYVSFSGGKDSTVLLHLVREVYPDVPAVFIDTGLEYPEIREFVKSFDNVIWLKPAMRFDEVIKKHGYPVISKEVSLTIDECRKGYKYSLKKLDPNYKSRYNCARWSFLMDAPFKISNLCCKEMKKKPVAKFERKHQLKPFIGTLACESTLRTSIWLRNGCNAFNNRRPVSTPLAFWKEEDIWGYLYSFNVPYSRIYDMGEERTGCMFCMFGVHLESSPNRFQRMAITHPKQYYYCMNNLGLKEVLDYIQVPYEPNTVVKKDSEGNKYLQYRFI